MRTIDMKLNTEAQRTQWFTFLSTAISAPPCFKKENVWIALNVAKLLQEAT